MRPTNSPNVIRVPASDLELEQITRPLHERLPLSSPAELAEFLGLLLKTKDELVDPPDGFIEVRFHSANDEDFGIKEVCELAKLARETPLERRLATFFYNTSHNYNSHAGWDSRGKATGGFLLYKDVRLLTCTISDNGRGFAIPIERAIQPNESRTWPGCCDSYGNGWGLTGALLSCDCAFLVSGRESAIVHGNSLRLLREMVLKEGSSSPAVKTSRINAACFDLETPVPGVFLAGFLYDPSPDISRTEMDAAIESALRATLVPYGATLATHPAELPRWHPPDDYW